MRSPADVTVTLRKLSREEAERSFARRGQTNVSEYATALRVLQVGDSAELELGGLSSRAAKRRLGLAATHLGYRLKWASAWVDDRLYFRVLPATASPAGRAGSRRRSRSSVGQPVEAPIPVATTETAAAASAPAPKRARRRRTARAS